MGFSNLEKSRCGINLTARSNAHKHIALLEFFPNSFELEGFFAEPHDVRGSDERHPRSGGAWNRTAKREWGLSQAPPVWTTTFLWFFQSKTVIGPGEYVS
jgi:hypothetical protein